MRTLTELFVYLFFLLAASPLFAAEEEPHLERWTVASVLPGGQKLRLVMSFDRLDTREPVLVQLGCTLDGRQWIRRGRLGFTSLYSTDIEFPDPETATDGPSGNQLLRLSLSLTTGIMNLTVLQDGRYHHHSFPARRERLTPSQLRSQWWSLSANSYGEAITAQNIFLPTPAAWSFDRKPKPAASVKLWRWLVEIPRQNRTPLLLLAGVLDPKGDPVLMEFAIRQSLYDPVEKTIFPSHFDALSIERFEAGEFSHPADGRRRHGFRISLAPRIEPRERGIKVFAPKSLLLFLDGSMVVETPGSQEVQFARIERIPIERYEPLSGVPTLPLVWEPSTIEPVSFKEFFTPKGLNPPEPAFSDWLVFFWRDLDVPQPDDSSAPAPAVRGITSAGDLQLGTALAGKPDQVWTLLQQTERPTIADIVALAGRLPKAEEENPFAEYQAAYGLKHEIEKFVPRILAQFERAFPGALWYGLGRDIYALADALEAFYTHIGQPGRVLRLHASMPSFNDQDVEQTANFLRANGFDFEAIGPTSQPRIIFDVTSYSQTPARFSQSAQLMRAAHAEWVRLGRDPHLLLPKVNFISTGHGGSRLPAIDPGFDSAKFFSAVKIDPENGPKLIPSVENSSLLQYTSGWHGIYGPFTTDAQGRVIAPPGPPAGNRTRLQILAEMWTIAATVMNKEFLGRVNQQAAAYGVSFTSCAERLSEN